MAASMELEIKLLKDIIKNRFQSIFCETLEKLDDARSSPRNESSERLLVYLLSNGYSIEYMELKTCVEQAIFTALFTGKAKYAMKMGIILQNNDLQVKTREVITKICQKCRTSPFDLSTVNVVAAALIRRLLIVISYYLESEKQRDKSAAATYSVDKENISDEALHYVGGFVMQSLKKKIKGQNYTKADVLKLISNMTSSFEDENQDYDNFSRSLNRGGLYNLNEQAFKMFKAMAVIAMKYYDSTRCKFITNRKVKAEKEIMTSPTVLETWEIVCDNLPVDLKEKGLKTVISTYLNTHGKAFTNFITEKYQRDTTKTIKSVPSLRKALNSCETNQI